MDTELAYGQFVNAMDKLLMRWITVHPQEQKAELTAEKRRKREAMSEELHR